MKPLTYLGLLLTRASQKSVLLTDQLTVLIVPFSTLVFWMVGTKMTNSIQETLALGVAMTVIVVVTLRLMAASYFVWKDDQDEKAKLRRELADPDFQVSASLKAYTTQRRQALSEKLALLSAVANFKTEALPSLGMSLEKLNLLSLEIDALINQLSYDPPLRVAAIRLQEYCFELITGKTKDRKRLWEQRKLTFRLIHKEDRIADFLTIIDLELLAGESWGSGQENELIADLKRMIAELGDQYYDPALAKNLRDALNSDSDTKVRRAARGLQSLQGIVSKKPQ